MRAYADQAQLNWAVGPLKLNIDQIEVSAHPKGATVPANFFFEGRMPIKLRYVLTYRESKIVSETWRLRAARRRRARGLPTNR